MRRSRKHFFYFFKTISVLSNVIVPIILIDELDWIFEFFFIFKKGNIHLSCYDKEQTPKYNVIENVKNFIIEFHQFDKNLEFMLDFYCNYILNFNSTKRKDKSNLIYWVKYIE